MRILQILTSKPDKDIRKRKLQAYLTPEHRFLNPKQIFTNQIQKCMKKIIYPNQVLFISGTDDCFNIQKAITICHYINRTKPQHHEITSKYMKGFDKF